MVLDEEKQNVSGLASYDWFLSIFQE